MEVSISVYKNWLLVNDRYLTPELGPVGLQTVLKVGRMAIIAGIDQYYEFLKQFNQDVFLSRPPIFTMRLGTSLQMEGILSKAGLANHDHVHTDPSDLKPNYQPYWQAVADSGFTPEAQSFVPGPSRGGVWLMLREAI